MKAEIISTGTELLLGDVLDTNTPYIARKLAAIGINVYHHTTVGDNAERLLEAIQTAEKRTDVVVVSGGLGPTQDDITKFMLADHLGRELELDQASYDKMQQRYKLNEISEGNYRQALILEGSEVLANDNGMAPGVYYAGNNHVYALLPGPPREFEQMVDSYLIPKLAQLVNGENILRSRNLNFYGLPEASIAEILYDVIKEQSNPTVAIYANDGTISVRLTASGQAEAECKDLLDSKEEEVLSALEPYFFGYEDISLHDLIFSKMSENKETIASLEVMTNGSVVENWAYNKNFTHVYKGGKVFTTVPEAKELLEADDTLTTKERNEVYAQHIKEAYKSDYGLAISRVGENPQLGEQEDQKFWISLALPNSEVITNEADYTYRSEITRWGINLRVSDFIRRSIYDLPKLEDIKIGKRE